MSEIPSPGSRRSFHTWGHAAACPRMSPSHP